MLKEIVNKVKLAFDNTEEINEIDEKYFAQVMKEIKDGYKEDGLKGKPIVMSGGDESKVDSIYIKLRAEYLQDKAMLTGKYHLQMSRSYQSKHKLSAISYL